MPKILAIVGSPKKNGLTHKLVSEAVAGAKSAGAETKTLYLADYKIKHCQDCRQRACWMDCKCNFQDDAQLFQKELNDCDGLIMGVPVYYFDVNSLSTNFAHRMRGIHLNGKWALGITIAGGTGKGLVLALKSLYYFFLCLGLRGTEPLPVCRFNFEDGLERARAGGRDLAQKAVQKKPFSGLDERIEYHYGLPHMNLDVIDENLVLAKIVVDHCPPDEPSGALKSARADLAQAEKLIASGQKPAATPFIISAYESAVKVWTTANAERWAKISTPR